MYDFLRTEDIKNSNVRHNLLAMDKQANEFNDGHEHAGGFIFLFSPKTQRTLLGLRSPDAEFEPNTWNPLGGTMEQNECPLLTAIRETYEEGKVSPSQYKINPNIMHLDLNDDAKGNTHRVYIYLATVDHEIEPIIDDEHTDAKWVHINELPNITLFSPLKKALQKPTAYELIKMSLLDIIKNK